MKTKILPFIKIVFLVLILSFFLLATTTSKGLSASGGWQMFQGNPARTGFSASSLPSNPKTLWQVTVGSLRELGIDGFETKRPVIDNNKVFFATSEVLGLNLENGKILWHYKDNTIPFYPGALAASDNKVFFAVNNTDLIDTMSVGHIYALKAETGEFLWKRQTQGSISHSKPLIAQNKIFIGDDAGYLSAISVNDGSLIWEKKVVNDGVIHASPAFADGKVFITTEGDARYYENPQNPSSVIALNPETGEIFWTFAISYVENRVNLIHSTAAVSDGTLYVGSENGWFYALSANDGSLIWKKEIANGAGLTGSSAPAGIGYGKVFIGTWQGKFFALSAENGETIWESSFGYANNAAPIIASSKVCVSGSNNSFYCLNEANGKLIWQKNLSATAAALSNDILIVPASTGDNFNNQTSVLTAFTEEAVSSPALEPTVPPTAPVTPLPDETQVIQPSEALSSSPITSPGADETQAKEASCGNTICEELGGEDENTCPQDCIPGQEHPVVSPGEKVVVQNVAAEESAGIQKDKNYLKIGLFIGGLILASGGAIGIWFFWKKRKKLVISPDSNSLNNANHKP